MYKVYVKYNWILCLDLDSNPKKSHSVYKNNPQSEKNPKSKTVPAPRISDKGTPYLWQWWWAYGIGATAGCLYHWKHKKVYHHCSVGTGNWWESVRVAWRRVQSIPQCSLACRAKRVHPTSFLLLITPASPPPDTSWSLVYSPHPIKVDNQMSHWRMFLLLQ